MSFKVARGDFDILNKINTLFLQWLLTYPVLWFSEWTASTLKIGMGLVDKIHLVQQTNPLPLVSVCPPR